MLDGKNPPNTFWPMRNMLVSKMTASASCARFHRKRGSRSQRTSNGVMTRAPPASPSHQVDQIGPYSDHLAKPPRQRLVTPSVALIAVLTRPARAANLILRPTEGFVPVGKPIPQLPTSHPSEGISNTITT